MFKLSSSCFSFSCVCFFLAGIVIVIDIAILGLIRGVYVFFVFCCFAFLVRYDIFVCASACLGLLVGERGGGRGEGGGGGCMSVLGIRVK